MSVTKVYYTFFALLKSGLWGTAVKDRHLCFPLAVREWQEVYVMAKQQTVEALVFEGVLQLDSSLMPPKDLLLRWAVRVEKIEQYSRFMDKVLADQVSFFAEKGIYPVLLKGQGVAAVYRNPRRRVCGDVDWYFNNREDYIRATDTVKEQGIACTDQTRSSCSYSWKGMQIEHHQILFDIHNPFVQGYLKRLEKGQHEVGESLKVGTVQVALLSPLVQVVQVSSHILKHLLSFGIGMRQVCDVACLYHAYQHQLDGDELRKIYRKLHIHKWIDLLHQLLVDYLGLDASLLPYSIEKKVNADWMMKEIWEVGNFGFHDQRYVHDERKAGKDRIQTKSRIGHNVLRYFGCAPTEAISFPLVHFYKRLTK